MNYLNFFNIDDNKKIGIFFVVLAVVCEVGGVLSFFNRKMFLIANLSFIFALYMFLGLKGTLQFFYQKHRIPATLLYFGGFSLIVMDLNLVGTLVQAVAIFYLFKAYLSTVYDWICRIPFIGKYLRSYQIQNTLDGLSNNTSAI